MSLSFFKKKNKQKKKLIKENSDKKNFRKNRNNYILKVYEKKKEENSINKPTPTSIFIFIKHDILSKGLLTYQAMKNLPHNSIQRRTRK